MEGRKNDKKYYWQPSKALELRHVMLNNGRSDSSAADAKDLCCEIQRRTLFPFLLWQDTFAFCSRRHNHCFSTTQAQEVRRGKTNCSFLRQSFPLSLSPLDFTAMRFAHQQPICGLCC
jgi:hypothetical protein